MKLFRLARKCYQTMGIHPLSPNQTSFSSLNLQNSFFFISMLLTASATMTSCIFQATENIFEHAYTLYVSLTQLASMINFAISFWKITEIIAFIESFENFIQKSKFSHLDQMIKYLPNKQRFLVQVQRKQNFV